MNPGLEHYLVLAALLFSFGVYGLLTRRNLVAMLLCVELILNAAALNFVAFHRFLFGGVRPAPASAPVREIGHALLETGPGGFALPFEVISLVLVAALVGAVTIAGRPGEHDDPKGGR